MREMLRCGEALVDEVFELFVVNVVVSNVDLDDLILVLPHEFFKEVQIGDAFASKVQYLLFASLLGVRVRGVRLIAAVT